MDILKDLLRPEVIWLLVGLGLMFLELMLPGLIVIFFGLAALLVGGLCFFVDLTINQQLVIFIIASIVLLVVLRGLLRKVFRGHSHTATGAEGNLSEFVGERAVVRQAITPKFPGKVEFHGSHWAAIADGSIAEGETVEIIGQDNLTLKVKAI